jgi:hypothetical protein
MRRGGAEEEKNLARIDLNYDKQIAGTARKGEELIKAKRETGRRVWGNNTPQWKGQFSKRNMPGCVPPS